MKRLRLLLVTLLGSALLVACGNLPQQVHPKKKQVVYYRHARIPPKPHKPVVAPPPVVADSRPAPALPEPIIAATDIGEDEDEDGFPADADVPANIGEVPDAVPRDEPLSAGGNSRSYEVFGKTYTVLDTASGYHQRGRASWYGKKFHGRKTSNGERYDMFAMTAAHRSLPIPSYVRVTNLDNGRSCVVRINDRGPFHSNRIIDLSYAAAYKLDMLQHGEIPVELTAIVPGQPRQQQAAHSVQPQYLQVGAFNDPINALVLREKLSSSGVQPVEVRSDTEKGTLWHRVLVGPFTDSGELESSRQRLLSAQFSARPVLQ